MWILGEGKGINFWHNKWKEDSPLVDKINPNMSHSIVKNVKVSDFINSTEHLDIKPLVNILPH